MNDANHILAFDTSNEVVSIAVGALDAAGRSVATVAHRRIPAHRASNTKLLPAIDDLLRSHGVRRDQIACVACGRGPGSFTGVRICMATAKGVASALEVGLVGLSTPDALAWELQAAGQRGTLLVLADAMRKEVYPVGYVLGEEGIGRQNADMVAKVDTLASSAGQEDGPSVAPRPAVGRMPAGPFDLVAGDALHKYADVFAGWGPFAAQENWTVRGPGLLACVQQMWRTGACDPFDASRHDPALALPVYTRLSDAEENERRRLSDVGERNLHTGVQHVKADVAAALRPLAAEDAQEVAALESQLMAGDAWNRAMVLDDLGRTDRIWWGAYGAVPGSDGNGADPQTGGLVGYAGGQVVDGQLQVLKIAVAQHAQRNGIARALLARMAADARDLGASRATLEVRAGNGAARALYESLGLGHVGDRPGYYRDGEDAAIYTGPLPLDPQDVAGMALSLNQAGGGATQAGRRGEDDAGSGCSGGPDAAGGPARTAARPLVLAIESSCDETAAAVIDGNGDILADSMASQIDFHARFGGVVPEIASRKHIEAICGVAQVCLEHAGAGLVPGNSDLGTPLGVRLRYRDLDAIAVTYAPGLVGALVVGVAFAKGAAWAADIPLVQVNHLEGHLYANRLATPDLEPPLVASLVSGGHTMLVHVRDWGSYKVLGSTIDDAVGEAFDKVSKALGLGYPGGPVISRLAAEGNPKAIDFPRAMMHSGDLRFSLSGLKTAVVTYIDQQRQAGAGLNMPDIAASFQQAVIDVQVAKACAALDETGAREFCLGGGVAANPALRAAYEQACARRGVRLTLPPLSACTDNAAMIALVALDRYAQGRFAPLDADAQAHADLEEPY